MTTRNLHLVADFDAAFARRTVELAMRLDMRPEVPADMPFLTALFVVCSPLAGLMPAAIVEQQAEMQRSGHNAAFPDAARCVIEAAGEPIGRAMIDWGADDTHLVDIAVLPGARATRAGRTVLLAWLEVADAAGRRATLEVLRHNPALEIYRKLGFIPAPGQAIDDPALHMQRTRR